MALTDKLTAIGDAIRSKTGSSDLLTLDEMPQKIQSIQTGGGGGADTGLADSLVNGTITSYSSDVQTLREHAFSDCALTSVSLPNVTLIPDNAFSYCEKLASCDFPKVETIDGAYTFNSCSSLEKIIFPSLTSISDMGMWAWCKSTLALILPNSTVATCGSAGASWKPIPFSDKKQGYIYVPKALIEQYKVATNWATFASRFRAIEDYPDICGEVA